MDKERNQIKQLKTAGYLASKDQDQKKYVLFLYFRKMSQKNKTIKKTKNKYL